MGGLDGDISPWKLGSSRKAVEENGEPMTRVCRGEMGETNQRRDRRESAEKINYMRYEEPRSDEGFTKRKSTANATMVSWWNWNGQSRRPGSEEKQSELALGWTRQSLIPQHFGAESIPQDGLPERRPTVRHRWVSGENAPVG